MKLLGTQVPLKITYPQKQLLLQLIKEKIMLSFTQETWFISTKIMKESEIIFKQRFSMSLEE